MERETASLDPLWTPKVELTKQPDTRLVLLQAPTGFGKTALASYWYQRWQHPRYWLPLTKADNSLHQLVAHLSEVLGLTPLRIASASEATLAAALVRQLKQQCPDTPSLLVIDDLHHLTEPLALEVIATLLSCDAFRGIICSRDRHSQLLTPFSLLGQLTTVGSDVLRLGREDIERLISHLPELPSDGWITQAEAWLQGWPAMWRMVIRLLQQGQSTDQLDFAELSADIADYLMGESLSPLPQDLRGLLITLSVFDEFETETAALASGEAHLSDKLQALQQRQLFLLRDHAQPGRFRWVPFFREALRHYLALHDSERLEIASHRGFQAWMQQSCWHQAAQLVLEQKSRVLAEQWLCRAGWTAFHHAQYRLLEQLFALLNDQNKRAEPELALLYGWLLLEGRKDSASADVFVNRLDTANWSPVQAGRIDAVRAEISYQFDRLADACSLAERALTVVEHPHDRLSAAFTRAMALLWRGEIEPAERQLQQMEPEANTLKQYHVALAVTLRQANLAQLKGNFASALKQVHSASEQMTRLNLISDHLNDAICRTQTELLLWCAHVDEAMASLQQGLALEKPRGDYWGFAYVYLQLPLLLLVGEDITDTVTELEHRLTRQLICRQWRYRALTALQLAYRWQDESPRLRHLQKQLQWHSNPLSIHDMQENVLFARNRLLLGQPLPATLVRQRQTWESLGASHLADQASWLLLCGDSLKWASAERSSATLTTLHSSIKHWLEGSYLWDLLLMGPQLISLWRQLKSPCAASPAELDSLNTLIRLCTQTRRQSSLSETPPDPCLTRKEWLVLQAIGRGYSNEQIAAQMHVAISTIKSHINHLYRKFDLNNRAEAKALAVRLSHKGAVPQH